MLPATVAGTLGDAGTSNSDAGFTGETGESALTVQYYRNKITEYQSVLTALDQAYQAVLGALSVLPEDSPTYADLRGAADEYESKRFTLKATAEAINMGAAAVNALGGRMPSLSLPSTLGIAPALPFAAIAAVGTAAVLISWGKEWLRGVNDRLKTTLLLDATENPEARAALAAQVAASDASLRIAEESGLAALAPLLKWGALGLLAFLAWKGFTGGRAARLQNPVDDFDGEDDDDPTGEE